MTDPAHFITIDLDLVSQAPLASLIAAMGEDIFVMHDEIEGANHVVSLNLTTAGTAAGHIAGLVALVEALPAAERSLWNDCTTRAFNLGFQSGMEPFSMAEPIPHASIAALARIGGEIVITLYAPHSEESSS